MGREGCEQGTTRNFLHSFLGNENWTQTFLSQTFRAFLAGYPGKIPGYPAKKSLISLVSRGIPNFLAPTPSSGGPPPQRKISGLKSLGLGSFFESITSRDAKSACFQGSQTSCTEIISGFFLQNLAEKDHITWWMRAADSFPMTSTPVVQSDWVWKTDCWPKIESDSKVTLELSGSHRSTHIASDLASRGARIAGQTAAGVRIAGTSHRSIGMSPRVLLALPIGFRNGSESRPIGFPNHSTNRTRRRPKAVPEYCWLSRLVSRMALNQVPSVFPIALPPVLGDTLTQS